MNGLSFQNECRWPKALKPIIDEIDCILGSHYAFTAEEVDFIIINDDIKYRMGQESEGAEEDRD